MQWVERGQASGYASSEWARLSGSGGPWFTFNPKGSAGEPSGPPTESNVRQNVADERSLSTHIGSPRRHQAEGRDLADFCRKRTVC